MGIHGSTAAGSARCAGKTSTPEQAPAAHRMYRRAAAAARPSSRHFAGNVFLFSKITFLELLRTHPFVYVHAVRTVLCGELVAYAGGLVSVFPTSWQPLTQRRRSPSAWH